MMISLRAYNLEINELIDKGQYEEAIVHSKHILTKFPKCVETYRNIGNSLLELKRYSEAKDIFTRVLTVFPDDFVSHVGLSIISEDQKNVDLAIWHMELAFDVQPSNLAVQDELKRLFKLRDGEIPSKIRLTRGALVRMYARGELYQQAITEIKSILEEDPKRIDLEVILAKMLYSSGSIDEAIKVCNNIINRIPFCFEVNQILEKVFVQKNAKENASVYRTRLISLDPYYEFSDSPFSDFEVPENNILLEKAAFSPYDTTSQTVDKVWSDESGLTLPEEPTENLDWLQEINAVSDNKTIDQEGLDSPPETIPAPEETDQSDKNDQMPDWMKQAGWQNSFDTGHLSLDHNAHYSFENDRPIFSNQEDDNSNNADSLEETQDHPVAHSNDTGQNISPSEETSKDLATFFSDLSEGQMNNQKNDQGNNNDESFPSSEWMSQFSGNDENPAHDDSASPDLPDWLKNINNTEPSDSDENSDMPSWLKDLQSEVEPVSSSEQTDDLTNDEPSPSEPIDSNGWEKIILSNEDKDELPESPSSETSDESSIDDDKIPDWVNSVLLSEETEKEQPVIQGTQTGPLNDDENDEINNLSQEDTGVISQQTNDELLDWLRSLKTEDEKIEAEGETVAFDSLTLEENRDTVEIPDQKEPQSEEDLNDLAAKILASQKLPTQKDYKLTDDVALPEEESPSSPQSDEDLNDLAAQILANQKLPSQKDYKLPDDVELPEVEPPAASQSEEDLNDLAAQILANQKLPSQKDYKLTDDVELAEEESPAPTQPEEDMNDLAAKILASQKLPVQKDYKLTEDIDLPETETPASEQSEEDLNDLAAKILASQKLPDLKGYKLSDDVELPENEAPAPSQTEEDLNERTAKILASQKLPDLKGYKLSDDVELAENETSLEDELSSLFNQPDTNLEPKVTDNVAGLDDKVLEQVSQIPSDNPEQNIADELSSLLDQKNYSRLTSSVFRYLEEGQDQDQLLEMIKPDNEELMTDFSYWQCLGDILAKMNKLSDALSSYKKAEEILIKNITD